MGLKNTLVYSGGNQLTLLHSGADFFPALIAAIDAACCELYLETYIFSEDDIGVQVHDALCRAAQRGVVVHVLADWLGTGHRRSSELAKSFSQSGVQFRSFNRWFQRGISRSHRKLFVADGTLAIIGGINITNDLFAEGRNPRPLASPRWDFATSIRGPLVQDIAVLMVEQWQKTGSMDLRSRLQMLMPKAVGMAKIDTPILAALAPRDNFLYRRTIQKAYLHAIGNARHEVLIATPYFAPGRKFRNALINATERGVKVTLLIGCGDYALQDAVAHSYYPRLLRHGVNIIEYRKSPLHAKVAVIDGHWATVGSSNCDGLSLLVNQEANILIRDQAFAGELGQAIQAGITGAQKIHLRDYQNIAWHRRIWHGCAFFIYSGLLRLIAVEDFL